MSWCWVKTPMANNMMNIPVLKNEYTCPQEVFIKDISNREQQMLLNTQLVIVRQPLVCFTGFNINIDLNGCIYWSLLLIRVRYNVIYKDVQFYGLQRKIKLCVKCVDNSMITPMWSLTSIFHLYLNCHQSHVFLLPTTQHIYSYAFSYLVFSCVALL